MEDKKVNFNFKRKVSRENDTYGRYEGRFYVSLPFHQKETKQWSK